MRCLQIKDFLTTGAAGHFARARFATARPAGEHDHDFLEVFWVASGHGWHWINGRRQALARGQVVFVRAGDRHAFSAAPRPVAAAAAMGDAEPLVFYNLAFAMETWQALRQRYGLADLFNPALPDPRVVTLTGPSWADLIAAATDLHRGHRDAMAVDRVLMVLARHAQPQQLAGATSGPLSGTDGAPAWLTRAIDALAEPKHLADGTRGLARLARRSPEHVARVVRRHLGKTPTDLVNDVKLALAAERLVNTDDAVLDVALDNGFNNLAHFYKVFAAKFGTTPRRHRLHQRRIFTAG